MELLVWTARLIILGLLLRFFWQAAVSWQEAEGTAGEGGGADPRGESKAEQ